MSDQHRYEKRKYGHNRIATVVTLAFGVAALCFAVVAMLFVVHEQATTLARVKSEVVMHQRESDARWCNTFETILTFPAEPNAPTKPTPGQERFAKALIKLAGEFGCVRQ